MTHRDGFPRFSARSAWRGDAGHRKPRAPSTRIGTPESLGPQDLGKPPPVARAGLTKGEVDDDRSPRAAMCEGGTSDS